jgi:hypothetical protein
MASTTSKPQSASIKSIMAGGVWRSRRVVATVAIAAGITFGFGAASVPQADASIGWCMRCVPNAAPAASDVSVKNIKTMYSVRPTVYASTN